MSVYEQLEKIRKHRGTVALALLDPDTKNDNDLLNMVKLVNESDFDAILVGGSLIMDNQFDERIAKIKVNSELPLIIFPGSSKQLSKHADAVLFLSLISGRNPQYLIGEQVESAPIIQNLGIEAIPTGYILLDGGRRSSVEVMSNTNPLPMQKKDIVLAHALAGEYLGKKFIFLETGSGSKNHAAVDLIRYLAPQLSLPLIVGGGVKTIKSARALAEAGSGYIVSSSKIESLPSNQSLIEFTQAIHLA